MPRYDANRIEPKWQAYWEKHRTFRAKPVSGQPKLYVLDMFPYPSGEGLHVGHPEGYTATDIVCRYQRMRGKNVLHPMGWDAFGLPAEQYAIKTGTHPAITTQKNIGTFRSQLKMLGFSYDWDREFSTTDPDYYRWTQWIFLQLFDTWYDPNCTWTGPDGRVVHGRGRPISELPIPADVRAQGETAVRCYQDKHRLAYQSSAPVNWCPALGTVLANEEVIDGKSERGGHPVVRIPLRQWMLRITAYADRLISELDGLDWSESIQALQRNWIGRSEGAEVDFWIGDGSASSATGPSAGAVGTSPPATPAAFESWRAARAAEGFPAEPSADVLRIYTTRPDTLFGVTYMVLAPEHPAVDRVTTPDRREAVAAYRQQAATKSDLDRTDLAKEKSGVFTGGYAYNPVNGEWVPIWIADYVLISYGTGAIMAVPAHDERDFEFAKQYSIPVRAVVQPTDGWLSAQTHHFLQWLGTLPGGIIHDSAAAVSQSLASGTAAPLAKPLQALKDWAQQRLATPPVNSAWLKAAGDLVTQALGVAAQSLEHVLPIIRQLYLHDAGLFPQAFTELGTAVNSPGYDGLDTSVFKQRMTGDLTTRGIGKIAVNYRLRDWLFSRQHFWGEPFPVWHELDAHGQPTGLMRTDPPSDLPVRLPDNFHFKPHGRPDPPLEEAGDEWLYRTAEDGVRLKRETNSMPQWAGSCWYYLRFADPKNGTAFIDPELEKYWLPVDLYIGGAEHAVLHLLYARFWHKVLYDRGYVSRIEPFQRLVNQGMILGDLELTGFQDAAGEWISARGLDPASESFTGKKVKLTADQVEKKGEFFVLKDRPEIIVDGRSFKMSKSRGNVINPDDIVRDYGADSLRLYEMFMGPLEATKPWSMAGVDGVYRFLGRVWRLFVEERSETPELLACVTSDPSTAEQLRVLHRTIKAVTDDIEKLSFNTAISRLMEFVNEMTSATVRPRAVMEPFVLLLSPLAPHLAEELWELLGHTETLAYEPWPISDPQYLFEAEVEVPVQINGKLRARVRIPTGASQETHQQLAAADAVIAPQLAGKTIVKVVIVPGKMVNFVVK